MPLTLNTDAFDHKHLALKRILETLVHSASPGFPTDKDAIVAKDQCSDAYLPLEVDWCSYWTNITPSVLIELSLAYLCH